MKKYFAMTQQWLYIIQHAYNYNVNTKYRNFRVNLRVQYCKMFACIIKYTMHIQAVITHIGAQKSTKPNHEDRNRIIAIAVGVSVVALVIIGSKSFIY